MKWVLLLVFVLLVLLSGPIYMAAYGSDEPRSRSWRTANRDSSGIAPSPQDVNEAIIQVYAARAYSWRGSFAVHSWISTKRRNADHYEVHYVMGFRARRGLPVVVSEPDVPDRYWYGSRPEVLLDIRGEKAHELIPRIHEAVRSYPYPEDYTVWPGPNSNTFTAHVGRQVPELGLVLPVTAIGKDYLPGGAVLGAVPSGTGYQFSLLGAFGVMLAQAEGFELNILGLSIGLDWTDPALKLPGVGRVGKDRKAATRVELDPL